MDSTFTNNIAHLIHGGAILWNTNGCIVDCNFVNSKWTTSNGIHAIRNFTIKRGSGIVDIVTSNTISGVSIVVLNNETYYYPPNTNINFNYTK